MFCTNCGREIQDTWVKCPYCGTKVIKSEKAKEKETEEMNRTGTEPLLIKDDKSERSFQSVSPTVDNMNGRQNKKEGCFTRIVKILIKILVVFLFLIGPFTGTQFGTTKDYVLEVIRYYVSLLLILVPLVTLICNTKGIRDKLPLFKKHKLFYTILGSFIVYFLVGVGFLIEDSVINSLHTEQYNQEYKADLEAKAKEAEQKKAEQEREEADEREKFEEKDKKVAETPDKAEKDVKESTEKETEKETEKQNKKEEQKIDLNQYEDSLAYILEGDAWKYAEANNIEMFNFVERKNILEFTSENNSTSMKENMINVEESTGLFSDVPSYKRTVEETGDYYVGSVNADNEPEGLGLLLKYNENYDMVGVKYVGYFKEGKFDGYGLKSEALDEAFGYGSEYLEGIGFYEGYFKEGKKCGKGMEFHQMLNAPDQYYAAIGDFDDDTWNGNIKEYQSGKLLYIGETKDGVYDGKGIQYDSQTGQIIYDGEFNNSKYDGKGTLYDENGDVVYEGEFQAGDIK